MSKRKSSVWVYPVDYRCKRCPAAPRYFWRLCRIDMVAHWCILYPIACLGLRRMEQQQQTLRNSLHPVLVSRADQQITPVGLPWRHREKPTPYFHISSIGACGDCGSRSCAPIKKWLKRLLRKGASK